MSTLAATMIRPAATLASRKSSWRHLTHSPHGPRMANRSRLAGSGPPSRLRGEPRRLSLLHEAPRAARYIGIKDMQPASAPWCGRVSRSNRRASRVTADPAAVAPAVRRSGLAHHLQHRNGPTR